MSNARWSRIQELIDQALEQPETERVRFLASRCEGDPGLIAEVLSLLQAPPVDSLPSAWLGALAQPELPRFSTGDRVSTRYRIERLLGRGGMGEVYEAWDDELGITVALKILRHADDERAALDRLQLEGMLARAVWHPNVCRVYDLGKQELHGSTIWFLTMERLYGATLAERLRERGRFAPGPAVALAEQMAAGLGAAHQAGVVHCDFKSANVMLVDDSGGERAVVTDFGTARAGATSKANDPQRGLVIRGTPAYMAPEQLRGEEAGPAADVYALGVVLFEVVTGRLPFEGDSLLEQSRRRLEVGPPSPRTIVADLDSVWEKTIGRCMARDPRDRFARAEDVSAALAGRATPSVTFGIADPSRFSLPGEKDAFVGREEELTELSRVLSNDRLVTLLGTSGMGKTRLAIRFAWRSLPSWPGGAWFCDLTDTRMPDQVAAAVADAFGLPIGRGDPVQVLGEAIARRGSCLMILDNFEGVAAHAPRTIGRWLDQAPDARWLVTSRTRLPLETGHVQPLESLPMASGVELFELRARGLRPGFSFDATEVDAIREIVRLVDGMPLAIELAAARIRVMPSAQIAARMRHRFQLLTGGRTARHETLEKALDASWELLGPLERQVWTQCSVFEGGFTWPAARAVIELGDEPGTPSTLDLLQSLVDQSLLRTRGSEPRAGAAMPEVRFGMYEGLQEYARMKLRTADGRAANFARAAELRHGAWYAGFGTTEAIDRLDRHGGAARRRQLRSELDNLVAACRRAIERRDPQIAAGAYRAAVQVYLLHGPYESAVSLGRELLDRVSLDPADEAQVLIALGNAERLSGQMQDAAARLDRARLLARDANERRIESTVLSGIATRQAEQGHMEDARAGFEAALQIGLDLGDGAVTCSALGWLGLIDLEEGREAEAGDHLERALAISRELGFQRFEVFILASLATLHRRQGRQGEAMGLSEQAVSVYRDMGDRRSEGLALGQLADVMCDAGRWIEAEASYQAAIRIARELGARRPEGLYLTGLGRVLARGNRPREARACFEEAVAIQLEVGDVRGEGFALALLGELLLDEGELRDARTAICRAESILRRSKSRLELARLLCARARLDHRAGWRSAASGALEEAEAIGVEVGALPDSELGQAIDQARREIERG